MREIIDRGMEYGVSVEFVQGNSNETNQVSISALSHTTPITTASKSFLRIAEKSQSTFMGVCCC